MSTDPRDPLLTDPAGDGEEFPEPQTGGMRRLRDAYDAQRKRLSEMEAEAEQRIKDAEAKGAQAATRRFQAEKLFGDLGYPRFADLWLDKNPEAELSDDTAKEFLKGLGIEAQAVKAPVVTPPAGPPPEVAKAMGAFVAPTGEQASDAGWVDREQLDELYRTNPRAALELLNSGRVRWKNLPNS